MTAPAASLLVLTNNYPPQALGGYEILCRDHVAWLRAAGHPVTVLTSTYGMDTGREREEAGPAGERVVRGLDFHWADFQHRRPRGLALWRGELRQRRLLQRLLRETRPAAALAWGMSSISKALLQVLRDAGVPTAAVVGEHWPMWDVDTDAWLVLWADPAGRRAGLARRAARRLAYRLVAPTRVVEAMRDIRPIFASEELRGQVEGSVPAWRGRGVVVPNGIRLDRYLRERDPEEPFHQPLRLLYAGRVERRKGVRTAVDCLARLAAARVPATLTLCGWVDEEYRAELDGLAAGRHLADRLTWRGAVAPEAMADAYREHDVLLFPSEWAEPFGLVPLEAMAAGCAVVATAVGGSREFLHDGENCLVFPPGDGASAADRVRVLAADPGLLARLRGGGLATARSHDFEAYAERVTGAALAGLPPGDGA